MMTARSIGRNVIGAIVTTREGIAPQAPLAKGGKFHYALTHPAADGGRFVVQDRGWELRQGSQRPTFQSTLIAGAVAVRYTPHCPLFKSALDDECVVSDGNETFCGPRRSAGNLDWQPNRDWQSKSREAT